MRLYYFLESIEPALRENLSSILSELESGTAIDELTLKYHIGSAVSKEKASKKFLGDPHFIEILGLLSHMKKEFQCDYKTLLKQVHFITRTDAFIFFSDTIYHAPQGSDFNKIFSKDTKEITYFMSARDGFFHPFFRFSENLSLINPALKIRNFSIGDRKLQDIWPYKDKLDIVSRLHNNTDEVLGDYIVPYYRGGDMQMVRKILDFSWERLGKDLTVKKSFGCAGETVRPITFKSFNEDTLRNVARDYFFGHGDFGGVFITPFYKIKKEFRIYYTFDGKKTSVFSIKGRKNTISNANMLKKTSFRIYSNIPVEWQYLGKKPETNTLKKLIDKITKHVGYKTGILEIIEDIEGRYLLMEINYLGSSLVFPNEDVQNMIGYNTHIFDSLFL